MFRSLPAGEYGRHTCEHRTLQSTRNVDPDVLPGPCVFPPLLGKVEQAVYCRHYLAICTLQQEYIVPKVSTYNFHILLTERSVASPQHLEMVHLQQAHGYKLNTTVGAITAHKVSDRLRYFHNCTTTSTWCLHPCPSSGTMTFMYFRTSLILVAGPTMCQS